MGEPFEVVMPAIPGVTGESRLSVRFVQSDADRDPLVLLPAPGLLQAAVRFGQRDTEAADLSPDWSRGLPDCSREDCMVYDGKRCRALGRRPGDLCEPAVAVMARLLGGQRG